MSHIIPLNLIIKTIVRSTLPMEKWIVIPTSAINNYITQGAFGHHKKTEVTSLGESRYPGFMLVQVLISAPRPVIHTHKSKIIIGNLGVKQRQWPSQSPKSIDLYILSAWKYNYWNYWC